MYFLCNKYVFTILCIFLCLIFVNIVHNMYINYRLQLDPRVCYINFILGFLLIYDFYAISYDYYYQIAIGYNNYSL